MSEVFYPRAYLKFERVLSRDEQKVLVDWLRSGSPEDCRPHDLLKDAIIFDKNSTILF